MSGDGYDGTIFDGNYVEYSTGWVIQSGKQYGISVRSNRLNDNIDWAFPDCDGAIFTGNPVNAMAVSFGSNCQNADIGHNPTTGGLGRACALERCYTSEWLDKRQRHCARVSPIRRWYLLSPRQAYSRDNARHGFHAASRLPTRDRHVRDSVRCGRRYCRPSVDHSGRVSRASVSRKLRCLPGRAEFPHWRVGLLSSAGRIAVAGPARDDLPKSAELRWSCQRSQKSTYPACWW